MMKWDEQNEAVLFGYRLRCGTMERNGWDETTMYDDEREWSVVESDVQNAAMMNSDNIGVFGCSGCPC